MCLRWRLYVFLLLVSVFTVDSAKVKHRSAGKQALKFLKSHRGIGNVRRNVSPNAGLWPSVFNLATKAAIAANATCGELERQEFCRMADNGKGRCGICDNFSTDPGKRHSIDFAIDGSNRWWQSPALHYGPEYEFVTVTVDLKQVYQIAYVIVKSANSPRPGTWILERSIDGENFEPWQYFARSDKECLERFGMPATKGKPHYFTDSEVICTSFYSRLTPMENGEIHTSLVHGRPGANETSPELLDFTRARYVRLRLMGLRGAQEPVPRWLAQDIWKDKRLFYSIRDISVGGQCVCNGHAENCRHNVASGHPECECSHHTCGPNCDRCCPMFNQRQWGPGSSRDARQCLPCNCHGHATSCHYDENVDKSGLSMDIHGNYQGGGVCDNCTDYTAGINCERCAGGYFRPAGTAPDAALPCRRCECEAAGSAGSCVAHGEAAGACRCRPGYAGDRCDVCAPGYGGYPECRPCPCDARGAARDGDCEGDCVCKANVEGKHCDRCKPGYFGLRSEYTEGCIPCYCSEVTTLCESAVIEPQKIRSLKDWLITDLKVTRVVKPNWNGQGVFSLGNYEFAGAKSLFWLAPEEYLGNKLEAYNSNFLFKVQWVVMRGDTSGRPTTGPNIILVGSDGLKIAHGDDVYTSSKMTFQIRLNEVGWYAIPGDVSDLEAVSQRTPVTRQMFLRVLMNVKYILLRSTFHTDQIEALLEEATLNLGSDGEGYSSVERCSCPSGYAGLSCERCSFGHVRIFANESGGGERGFCGKCDCNGHSESCDPDTGGCLCLHHTAGEKCERCAAGYYGNPLRGTPADCRRCACPLEDDANNFSPACQLDYSVETAAGDDGGYVCTQCPRGYTGDHCEICDDGYYGNPMELGSRCQPCDCNGGPCNKTTGQCLSCKGNTEGWKCERCKPEHYGEPSLSNCKVCECDPIGSLSKQCDNASGQCTCKEKFTGRTCDRCEVGYGNVTALCTRCSCSPMGSKSEICDTRSGMCNCQPGVEGFHCDACQNFHYGFSEEGCKPCNCDEYGSKFPTCTDSGACVCKPQYTGKTCSVCKDGYWKNKNEQCIRCNCNEYGTATNTYCDKSSGRCYCKTGVGGDNCDTCLPFHYGTIQTGCKECGPCNKEGHICHPQTGKCVCPPLAGGEICQRCVEYAWAYEPGIGCKACNCSETGSASLQCDQIRGVCTCKTGYEGEKCDRCSFGYYGYPHCRRCDCNLLGTVEEDCQNGECLCDNDGKCRCKENVQGKTCNICKTKTFGLAKENSKGCTPCFCFGRSNKCTNANLNWDKIRMEKIGDDEMDKVSNDYWKLPTRFMGDLTTSYGGYLSINASRGRFQVNLIGNGVLLQASGNKEIQLIEPNWNIASRNPRFPASCQSELTRACFMVVLQNVTSFLVEANDRIYEVLLDKAISGIPTYPIAHTIEKCECPTEYTGFSCQDPNEGYFRYFSNNPKDKWIDLVVGRAEPCECNGKSTHCHPDTGHCRNCTEHRTGDHCELCDEGYYLDHNGDCSACLCPSADQNNAESCSPRSGSFVCKCKKGYKGQFCERCEVGYFDKDPSPNSMICEPCGCNPYGVVDGDLGICDDLGYCQCKAGFKGKKCNECVNEREYIKNGICTPCDECAQLLFAEIDKLTLAVEETFNLFRDGLSPPWKTLTDIMDKHDLLSERFKNKKNAIERLLETEDVGQCKTKVNAMENKLKKENEVADNNSMDTNKLRASSDTLLKEIEQLSDKLRTIVEGLENFGTKHVNLKDALRRSREILKQIKKISKIFKEHEDQETFYFCSNVTERVNSIYKPPGNVPKEILEDLKTKLNNIIDITASVEHICMLAENKNLRNSERIMKIKEKIEKIKYGNQLAETTVKDILSKINATDDLIRKLEVVYEDLKNISNFVEYKQLEQRVKRQMEESADIEELFLRALDHVQELQKTIDSYQSIFNFSKDEWSKINASGAYEALINGIREAKHNIDQSREILEKAIKIIDPEGSDSIVDKANLAHAYSDRLKQRINNLKNISKSLNLIKSKLDNLKYSILENGKANNDLNQILHKMESEITSQSDRVVKLEEVILNSTDLSDEMRQLEKKIYDMQFTSQYDFFKKYNHYLNLTSKEEIDKLKSKLNSTRKQLEDLNINSTYFDSVKKFNGLSTNKNLQAIQEKINGLRNRIHYAKQAADAINVAMNLTECAMVYRLPQAEIFQSLSVTFKCKRCNLFKWSNKNGQSLSLRVENSQPKLQIDDKKIDIDNREDREKTVNIQRFGSLIKMQFEDIEKSIKLNSYNYIIDTDDDIKIGNLDNPVHGDAYIYKVMLNDKNFGLWKFFQTQGQCKGQRRDTTDQQTDSLNTYFNGKGYHIFGRNRKLNPSKLTLVFTFTTFDENSLIYLAQEDNCAYMVLSLKNGYLNLKVRHSNGVNTSLVLDNKYNDGKKYHVEITMEYDSKSELQHYILFAKNDTSQDRKRSSNELTKKNVFKIKQASHYIGGVPPTVNTTCVEASTTSFLGFLQLSSQLTNESIVYGVIKTKKEFLEFYQAWINKNGFLRVKLAKEHFNTISFILRPTQPNGLIMNLTQYLLYLNNYRLQIINEKSNYSSDITLSKNDYNMIQMSIKHGKVTINEKEFKVQFIDKINIQDLTIQMGDSKMGFTGGISNILINNKELLLNASTVVELSNVEIGRERPIAKTEDNKLKSLSTNLTNSMQNTEGCASLSNYVTDIDAVKFGDRLNSYTHIKSKFWKSDYKIAFKFRTFYPNGILFISIGIHKQTHYNFLELREGKLTLHIKGRKKNSPIVFNGKMNDGKWHNIQLFKKKRKLTVILDGNQKKPYRIPKNVVRDEIYLGGVPSESDYLTVKDLKDKLHPFRGCMKSLIINEEHKFLLKSNKFVTHSNIRQCFPNIEQGAYFGGDAYAVYKEHFQVTKLLELSFEFRTAEQNGILLSVSNFRNSPALSVELQNGAVVMAVDMGNGPVSNVTNNLNSDFALCNNHWHNVTAMYSNSELTVNVDGIRKIWVQSDVNSLMEEIDAPLYVGGLPDNAPVGTLKSRENFKGCIRRLKIEDKLMDWSDMKDLNNVLLNSCPVEHNDTKR